MPTSQGAGAGEKVGRRKRKLLQKRERGELTAKEKGEERGNNKSGQVIRWGPLARSPFSASCPRNSKIQHLMP